MKNNDDTKRILHLWGVASYTIAIPIQSGVWRSKVCEYIGGNKSREDAIAEFKLEVAEREKHR